MSKVKEYYLEEEYNPIEAIDKLQQENTKLRIQISAREEEYIKLQQENAKLKELCNKYEEEHSTIFQIWKYNKDTYKEENERLNNILDKTNWWLNEMLRQATNDETKAIINGTLELLLKGDNK